MKVEGINKNIQVVVRVRPLNTRELEQNQRVIIKVEDTKNLLFDPDEDEDEFFFHGAKQSHRDVTKKINKKLLMEFDEVFDNNSENVNIFTCCMKPLVDSVMAGYNCSVFVYGATGAGKTHTMLGNESHPGITYLTMRFLFEQINNFSAERKFDIGISYLEVYNEQVMNLLTKSEPLKLREDSHGVVVGGLSLKPIYNADELLSLLALGNKNRTQHPTDANSESSRSHAIFQVHIRMINKKTGLKNTVKLSMIDLAGSERAASTKCMGLRFKEGASINKSLLALGNCINKLADGSKHIPYRDSNLTRILKDSLGGNCQTLMIANISPSSLTYEDTYNTLKYASRAKKIRSTLKVNMCNTNLPKELLMKKLAAQQSENEKLKEMVTVLEAKLSAAESQKRVSKNHSSNSSTTPDLNVWYSRIDSIYAGVKCTREQYFTCMSMEYVMKIRTKIKESAEEAKKALVLDGGELSADLTRLEASKDKYGIQILRLQDDLVKWKKRVDEKQFDLQNLRIEIERCEFEHVLNPYIKEKDMDLEASNINIKALHIMKVNSIYIVENNHHKKIINLSNSLLQHVYLLLRSMNCLDADTKQKFEAIKKLNQGQREVKFMDAEENSNDKEFLSLLTLPISDDAWEKNVPIPLKRQLRESDDEDISNAKVPRRKLPMDNGTVKLGQTKHNAKFLLPNQNNKQNVINCATKSSTVTNLNETHVVANTCLPSGELMPITTKSNSNRLNAENSKIKSKTNLLKNILTENGTNMLYDKVIKMNTKAIQPSKVTLNINKENKKFSPLRARKSPKSKTPRPISLKTRHRALTTGDAKKRLKLDQKNSK